MFESKGSCEFCKIDKEIKKFDRRNGGVLKITIARCLMNLIVFSSSFSNFWVQQIDEIIRSD